MSDLLPPNYVACSDGHGPVFHREEIDCPACVVISKALSEVNALEVRIATLERKRGREKHNMYRHPAYNAWAHMIQRCTNPKCSEFHNYGGRGISVCSVWRISFNQFWQDMGGTYKEGLELDRIDVNGNYTPENCRWATRLVQSRNTRKRIKASSRYRGVSWYARDNKWQAFIKQNGRSIYLGRFENEEAAAKAYNTAALQHFGTDAKLNAV